MGPIAMTVAIYALVRFHLRNIAIGKGGSMMQSGNSWNVPDHFHPLFSPSALPFLHDAVW